LRYTVTVTEHRQYAATYVCYGAVASSSRHRRRTSPRHSTGVYTSELWGRVKVSRAIFTCSHARVLRCTCPRLRMSGRQVQPSPPLFPGFRNTHHLHRHPCMSLAIITRRTCHRSSHAACCTVSVLAPPTHLQRAPSGDDTLGRL
jgi:hypothetical protein